MSAALASLVAVLAAALAAVALAERVSHRLLIGWLFAAVVSFVGIAGSAALDLPTGATVVCAFGLLLTAVGIAARVLRATS